jgi:hypothetical protein
MEFMGFGIWDARSEERRITTEVGKDRIKSTQRETRLCMYACGEKGKGKEKKRKWRRRRKREEDFICHISYMFTYFLIEAYDTSTPADVSPKLTYPVVGFYCTE